MIQTESLRNHFRESTIYRLEEIFDRASKLPEENVRKELQEELRAVLQQEMNAGLMKWVTSPSGNNHLIVIDNLCLLVNVSGINILLDNWLFFDGELDVLNFQWIENDHLVVFDVYYIVHDEWQKCICHFAPTDFFVYFTPIKKEHEIASNNDTFNAGSSLPDID